MLLLLQAVTRNNVLVRTGRYEGIALSIARNKLESVRSGGYTSVPATGSFSDSLTSSLPLGATALITTSAFNAKTKQVTIDVSWRDSNLTSTTSVSLSTLITQVGGLP
ncbi:MAG: hypothetical protein JWN18_318 [Parcubacteria group bacterium]|nr:hypothetical protein [Parcubacteria group bacterium]